MQKILACIIGKPSDFKICIDCSSINWYENEECHECGGKYFEQDDDEVLLWAQEQYDAWIREEGYPEEEVDDIPYDV